MILESKYKQWLTDKTLTFDLPVGTIYFDRMVSEKKMKKGGKETLVVKNIKRTDNHDRIRPDAVARH